MPPLPTSTPTSRRLPDNSPTRWSNPMDGESGTSSSSPPRGNAHRHEPHRFGSLGPATPANHALAHQCSLDPGPLVHADLPISAILRKADTQLLCLLQMGQTRSLPLAQAFKVPIRHRALHLSGNSAAVQSFAGSDHGEKYGVAGVVTLFILRARRHRRCLQSRFARSTDHGSGPVARTGAI